VFSSVEGYKYMDGWMIDEWKMEERMEGRFKANL
jgi:hypothetical protein